MSRFSTKCNELSIVEYKLFDEQRNYYMSALRDASRILLDLMEREIKQTVHGDGPGKPDWRERMAKRLEVVYVNMTSQYLEYGVGQPDDMVQEDQVKAMIIAYGAGSAAGNSPITAGPEGRLVWDDDISGKKESQAKSVYLLPEPFNQEGNRFIENSIRMMKMHFDDVLEEASINLPERMFYSNVTVKQR